MLMRLQYSRPLVIVTGQSLVNVTLAAWLYVEYAHNRFGQEYLSSFLTTNLLPISVAIVLAVGIPGGAYLALSKRIWVGGTSLVSSSLSLADSVSPSKLEVLDHCPVCNVPLKALSENRFQCRNCHRYFKK
jgi:hypothetical protein